MTMTLVPVAAPYTPPAVPLVRTLGLEGWLPALSALTCLDIVLFGLSRTSPSDVNGLGLAGALSPWYFVGLGGILVTLVAMVSRPGGLPRWSMVPLLALVVALTAAPALVEPLPRFATAWTHAGFAEYIGRSGQVLAHNDARFSWPAFFAAAGMFAKAAGVAPQALLRWTPLLLDLLYLVPLAVIVRAFVSDARQRVLALALFVVGNWVGQDYFAPQGWNFLLYLTFLAVLLTALSGGVSDNRLGRVIARLLRRSPDDELLPTAATTPTARIAALLALVALYSASAVSHQLTQFFMLFAAAALVGLGRCRLRGLPILLACISAAYILWGAQDFWFGHLHDLTSGVGALGTSVHENVTSRVAATSTPTRTLVLRSRLLLTVLIWLLAIVGLVRSRRRLLVVPALLAVMPFLVLGLQSYGGEALLRVHLFAMPFVAVLASYAWRPAEDRADAAALRRVALQPLIACVVGAALLAGFLVARYGNEEFERMRPADARAVSALYEVAPRGATLFVVAESVPWRQRKLEDYNYRYATPLPLTENDLRQVIASMLAEKGPSFLLATDGQWAEMRDLAAVTPEQVRGAQQLLRTTPLLTRIYGAGDIGVYVPAVSRP
ncbi:MAG: hypothetical protein QOJ79_605 [Actinomycetota bacterium]|jgi:hypothetical protein|nr:hypothetical protein [Actinomycetota bacterium]